MTCDLFTLHQTGSYDMSHVMWCNFFTSILSTVNYRNGNSYTKFALAWPTVESTCSSTTSSNFYQATECNIEKLKFNWDKFI